MSKGRSITAIITRTKNRPMFLERAVKSVMAQTSKDYVHVILNDGGDAHEVDALLKRYTDSRRVVIHNKSSVGLTRALNQAIGAVDSEYIAILDDDDSWMPERVARVSEYLQSNPDAPAVAVQMDRVIEEVRGNRIVEISRDPWHPGVTEVSLYDQLLDNYLSNGCTTYRRSVYNKLSGYDEELEVAEDWDFGIRLMLTSNVSFIPGVLTLYHHRPQVTGSNGNSVFAGIDIHKRNLVRLRNRYLRNDINNGVFGVGYIMNNLSRERDYMDRFKAINDDQSTRIEGHINSVATRIESSVESASLFRTVKRKIQSR